MQYNCIVLEFDNDLTAEQEKYLIQYFGRAKLSIKSNIKKIADGNFDMNQQDLIYKVQKLMGAVDATIFIQNRMRNILQHMETYDLDTTPFDYPVRIVIFDKQSPIRYVFMLSKDVFEAPMTGNEAVDKLLHEISNYTINKGLLLGFYRIALPNMHLKQDNCKISREAIEI